MRLNAFDHWQDHAYKNNDVYQRFEKSGNTKPRLEPEFFRFARKAANGRAGKQVAGNPRCKKMLNHQPKYRMDMQVYPTMRSGSGIRQGIGKNQK